MATSPSDLINNVAGHFARIHLGGIPSLLNDEGAFLSFICVLSAIEALGMFVNPQLENGPRFRAFIQRYFPDPYPAQAEDLWKFRNAIVHAFSAGPYKLTHHNSHIHLKQDEGLTILNAEDFYATLVFASKRYFDELANDSTLQQNLIKA